MSFVDSKSVLKPGVIVITPIVFEESSLVYYQTHNRSRIGAQRAFFVIKFDRAFYYHSTSSKPTDKISQDTASVAFYRYITDIGFVDLYSISTNCYIIQ